MASKVLSVTSTQLYDKDDGLSVSLDSDDITDFLGEPLGPGSRPRASWQGLLAALVFVFAMTFLFVIFCLVRRLRLRKAIDQEKGNGAIPQATGFATSLLSRFPDQEDPANATKTNQRPPNGVSPKDKSKNRVTLPPPAYNSLYPPRARTVSSASHPMAKAGALPDGSPGDKLDTPRDNKASEIEEDLEVILTPLSNEAIRSPYRSNTSK